MDRELLLKKFKDQVSLASVIREKTRFSIGPLSLQIAADQLDGIRSGRMITLAGRESSGKTTLALDIVRQYQQEHPEDYVLWVDFERAMDENYARAIGVDLNRLLIVRAPTTERGLDILEEMIEEGAIKLAVIDSVAAAKPSSEEDKKNEDPAKMASNGLVLTRFANRVRNLLDDNDALLIVLNQMRDNTNSLSPEKEKPYGPRALIHASDLTIYLTMIKREDTKINVQALVRKNRVGAPAKRCTYTIVYRKGIDHAADTIELGVLYGIVTKAGAWLRYGEMKAQGVDNAAMNFPLDEIARAVIEKVRAENIGA